MAFYAYPVIKQHLLHSFLIVFFFFFFADKPKQSNKHGKSEGHSGAPGVMDLAVLSRVGVDHTDCE